MLVEALIGTSLNRVPEKCPGSVYYKTHFDIVTLGSTRAHHQHVHTYDYVIRFCEGETEREKSVLIPEICTSTKELLSQWCYARAYLGYTSASKFEQRRNMQIKYCSTAPSAHRKEFCYDARSYHNFFALCQLRGKH